MRHLIIIIGITILMTSCSLMPPRRQYNKEAKLQVIPKEILNTNWTLETVDNRTPDCSFRLNFLIRGELTFNFKEKVYRGDHSFYLVKDSVIELHMHPQEKFAWTEDNCEINPSSIALLIRFQPNGKLIGDKLIFISFDKKEFVFRKV